jgi:hypothetical protein
MDTVREGEDREFSLSDEEEDGDLSNDEDGIAPERDAGDERAEPEDNASAEGHGLDATARRSTLDRGDHEETVITGLSIENEGREESGRSSTGSGVPSVARSVSVETGLRELKVSEGGEPEKGERTPFVCVCVCSVKARSPHPGF